MLPRRSAPHRRHRHVCIHTYMPSRWRYRAQHRPSAAIVASHRLSAATAPTAVCWCGCGRAYRPLWHTYPLRAAGTLPSAAITPSCGCTSCCAFEVLLAVAGCITDSHPQQLVNEPSAETAFGRGAPLLLASVRGTHARVAPCLRARRHSERQERIACAA